MTSNHSEHGRFQHNRPAGALLAGVCAGLAQRLGWNAWAIRALFVLGLFIQAIGIGTVVVKWAFVSRAWGDWFTMITLAVMIIVTVVSGITATQRDIWKKQTA